MKSEKLKSALLVCLTLISLSCFVFVNTTSVNSALSVDVKTVSTTTAEAEADEARTNWDLTLIKNAVVVIQKFLPAK
jgi:hypothetical protein